MKENILFIVLCVACLGIGWWARGCTVGSEVRERIENAPQTIVNHPIEKPIPLPKLPAPMKPAKPGVKLVTDTAAFSNAIDSISRVYKDSLSMMRELLNNRKYEYADTAKGFYMSLEAMTPVPPVITDLRMRPMKCDSIVITKLVPVEPNVPWYDHWYVPIAGELLFIAAYIFAAPK